MVQHRYLIRGEYGLVLNPFSVLRLMKVNAKWKITGQPQAVIISHRTAQNFGIYLPEETKYFYIDKDATTKVLKLYGSWCQRISAITSDTASPDIMQSGMNRWYTERHNVPI